MHFRRGCFEDDSTHFVRTVGMLAVLASLVTITSGCGSGQSDPASESSVDADAILQEMIAAYQAAHSYSDRGVVRLTYRNGDKLVTDEGKLAVKFRRSGQLQLRAYQLTMICDAGVSRAIVADQATADMNGQVAVRSMPQPLTLDPLYEDPVVLSVVAGGMGGPPVTLEMLLGDRPLANLFEADVTRQTLEPERIGKKDCHRIRVELKEGPLVFWIDRQSHLLLRLAYPTDRMAQLVDAGADMDDVSLVAEFRDARMNTAIPADEFVFRPPSDAKLVDRFVLPPQPLASPLIGTIPEEFFFTDLSDQVVPCDDFRGRTTVMVWFNDHPASAAALQLLQAASSEWSQDLELVAVCTEPSRVGDSQLRSLFEKYELQMRMLRDLEACGRDIFSIPWAPTTIVFDNIGRIQHYEVGMNPQLAASISDVLLRLAAGEDVSAVTLERHREKQQAYETAIAAATTAVR